MNVLMRRGSGSPLPTSSGLFILSFLSNTMKIVNVIGVTLLAIYACAPASAQTPPYPDKSKPIKIIVPFGAGSGTDLLARALARAMSETTGVKAIVDNKPGAEGVIGMQAAKNAPPDGYTMVLANISTQVLNAHMLSKLAYDPAADFVPVSGVAKFTNVMNATASLPHKSLKDLIEDARRNPQKYRFGSATTFTRLEMLMFEHNAKVKVLQVPYKAMAEATTALVSGELDLLFNDAVTAAQFYQTGKIFPIAVTGATRMVGLPNVPTFRELGLSEFELTGWIAMYFPAKTPPAIVTVMRELLQDAAKSSIVKESMARASFEPLELTGTQVELLQKTDFDRLGKVVREVGLQPR